MNSKRTLTVPWHRLTDAEVREYLIADGYPQLARRVRELREAARTGSLLWSSARIVTTDSSRIDERRQS